MVRRRHKKIAQPIGTPPEITPPSQLKLVTINSADDIDAALAQLTNLNEKNILHEPTCLICNSPYREDAEKKWVESDKSHQEIKDMFKNRGNIELSDNVIDNHMEFHFNRGGITELQKIEYIDRIKRHSTVDLTTLDRLKMCLSALNERLIGINSITPDQNTSMVEIQKIKSVETSRIMTAVNQLLKLYATIKGEMKSSGELIILPRDPFIQIFHQVINESSPGEVEVVRKIMSKLLELDKSIQ